MLVSELEKKAEIKIRIASAAKSRPSDVSFKSGGRLYNSNQQMLEKNSGRHKSVVPEIRVLQRSHCVSGNSSSSTNFEPKKPSTTKPKAMVLRVIADCTRQPRRKY